MKTAFQKTLSKHEQLLLAAGFAALALIVLFNTRAPFYDEVYYLKNVEVIRQYGLGRNYLLHLIGSAGPLYSIVHHFLEPITHLKPPLIRVVNIAFLAGSLLLIGKTIELIKYGERSYAWYVMAVPMTYVIAGLALTEMPAIFFLAAAFYFLMQASNKALSKNGGVIYAAAAGLCMSLAILGRQPYLLALAAFPIPFLGKEIVTRQIILCTIALIFATALPAYVFYVWQGFVAPDDAAFYQDIKEQGISFAPQYVILCLSYFALLLALISPGTFIKPGKKMWLTLSIIFIAAGIVNYFTQWVVYLPLKPYTGKLFSSEAQILSAEIFCGTLLIVFALYLLLSLTIHIVRSHFDKHLLFFCVALLMVAISCIKITYGFSSRYAAQAIPMIIPIAALFYKSGKYAWLRAGLGVILGLLSLASFIFQEHLK